jgi:hypothetical protein
MTTYQRLTAAISDLVGPAAASGLNTAIDQLGWAEDEITRAQRRHRSQSDLLYRSFFPAHLHPRPDGDRVRLPRALR